VTLLSQEKKTRREVVSAQRHEFVVLVDLRGLERTRGGNTPWSSPEQQVWLLGPWNTSDGQEVHHCFATLSNCLLYPSKVVFTAAFCTLPLELTSTGLPRTLERNWDFDV